MNKIIVITGQTATGKTNLALELAHKHNGELINCDSRQIYKHLDIITGKDLPTNSEFRVQNSEFKKFDIGYYLILTDSNRFQPIITRLWLYDIVDPKQYFSSFDFVQCAQYVIQDIMKRGKTPIIIGGTGLYLNHLINGFDYSIPPNWPLRKKLGNKDLLSLQTNLQKLISSLSHRPFQPPVLKEALEQAKLMIKNNSDFNNPHRLIRRIEILSSPNNPNKPNVPNLPNVSIKYIGLQYKHKEDLIKAIKTRVEKRLKQGALREVQKLLEKGYTENDPGFKTIGYQQLIQYLNKKISLDEAVTDWTNKEIQYAKRQLTYLDKYFKISWKEI